MEAWKQLYLLFYRFMDVHVRNFEDIIKFKACLMMGVLLRRNSSNFGMAIILSSFPNFRLVFKIDCDGLLMYLKTGDS